MELSPAIISQVASEAIRRLKERSCSEFMIPIGISNRHIHLSKEDLETLFGAGYKLTVMKALLQPGQYAAEEIVSVEGPKGSFDNVRILGPIRGETQLELSVSDGYKLGMDVPVRESGSTEGTPGILLRGPKGVIWKATGVIAALRHVHMPIELAMHLGLKDKEMVSVEAGYIRKLLFHNVLVRVSDQFVPELHLDTDEANACGIRSGDMARIIKDQGR
ncbi:MAG TPA: phosphate propanoyltransferase [Negativicutes bacterium]|nr:phosphate propanoyltransferase [Negativicutes bacterium]